MVGGVSAELSGGTFFDGFRHSVLTAAFNHVMHDDDSSSGGGDKTLLEKIDKDIQAMKQRLANLKVSNDQMFASGVMAGTIEGIYKVDLLSDNKFFVTMGKKIGNLGIALSVADIGISSYSIYQNRSTQNILSESYNITGNVLSFGIGVRVGSLYGGAYGAGAGVTFDIMWYTMPAGYSFLYKQYNLFKSDLSKLETGLRSGLWKR